MTTHPSPHEEPDRTRPLGDLPSAASPRHAAAAGGAGGYGPSHGPSYGSSYGPGYGAAHPSPQAPRAKTRRRFPLGRVLVGLLALVMVGLVVAEFGARWYMRDEITTELRDYAAASGVELVAEPEVHFGWEPVILGLARGSVPKMDMVIPSSLDVSYVDNDRSKPIVKGDPEVRLVGEDITPHRTSAGGQATENATVGTLDVSTSIPDELMLAEVQRAIQEKVTQAGGNPLVKMLNITEIRPNSHEQVLEVFINDRLASVQVRPVVTQGQVAFEVQDAKVLGISLPSNFTSALQTALGNSAQRAPVPAGLDFQSARVTDQGLDLQLSGRNVDLKAMTSSLR